MSDEYSREHWGISSADYEALQAENRELKNWILELYNLEMQGRSSDAMTFLDDKAAALKQADSEVGDG